MDHRSDRQDENQGEPFGQVNDRSMRLDKGTKSYLGISTHRSTRLDNDPGDYDSGDYDPGDYDPDNDPGDPQDQHDYTKLNSKFSSQGCLNR